MESINPNISSVMQSEQMQSLISFNPMHAGNSTVKNAVNDAAFSCMPQVFGAAPGFDTLMNNFAAFKDIISVAQGGISEMKSQGESIRDLVKQAQEEGITPELLDKIQAEVDARVAQIQRIRDGADYNGINPFNGSFSLDVPNILELMGKQNKEEFSKDISDMMASFDIDISIEGDGFSIGGSAKIEIGMTEDGALQINVDASMDYDLSGLVNNGVDSDKAFDIINNFINMLGVQQGDLGNAQNFLDAIVEQIFNAMNGEQKALPDGVEITPDSSNSLKGQMVQQASITLDGAANQMPNIAINIL
jgi:flagellin-like hook-associated protein FlgL